MSVVLKINWIIEKYFCYKKLLDIEGSKFKAFSNVDKKNWFKNKDKTTYKYEQKKKKVKSTVKKRFGTLSKHDRFDFFNIVRLCLNM